MFRAQGGSGISVRCKRLREVCKSHTKCGLIVRTQTDISKTKYTTLTEQSSNILHKQGYGYLFRTMLDIFMPISCNFKFSYLRYNAYQVSVFVILYSVSSESINTLWTGDADLRLYITTVRDG